MYLEKKRCQNNEHISGLSDKTSIADVNTTYTMKDIPPVFQIIVTIIIVLGSVEVGYRVGCALEKRARNEKGPLISIITGAVLSLLSFILAFTFGVVADKFDARKRLIREEANQIYRVWLRADFMPEADKSKSRKLLNEYLHIRTTPIEEVNDESIVKAVARATDIQNQLWAISISHSRTEMQSDIGSLYFDSLNDLIDLQSSRVRIGYQTQTPFGLWISIYSLLVFAMLSTGYYAAIIHSKRNFGAFLIALSFCLVIFVISNLDQGQSSWFRISYQPFIDLQNKISNH
jgi:hypothetical protein